MQNTNKDKVLNKRYDKLNKKSFYNGYLETIAR